MIACGVLSLTFMAYQISRKSYCRTNAVSLTINTVHWIRAPVLFLAPCNLCVVGSAMLPSNHCRFSMSQQQKIMYQSHPRRDHALSSVTMFQMYQAMCLAEVGEHFPPESLLFPLINEVRNAIAHSLLVSWLSLGRGMPSTVMSQRHLSPILHGLSIWTSLCRLMFVWTITKWHPGEVWAEKKESWGSEQHDSRFDTEPKQPAILHHHVLLRGWCYLWDYSKTFICWKTTPLSLEQGSTM